MNEKQQQQMTFMLAMLLDIISKTGYMSQKNKEYVSRCSNKTDFGFTDEEKLNLTIICAEFLRDIDDEFSQPKYNN